jgi:glycosyltransferase involved in cell wall biosynthesis
MNPIEYSVVVPVYCAENSVEKLHEALVAFFKGNYSFEIIYVDDFSEDNSWEVLKKIKSDTSVNTKIIRLSKNFGQHAASMCGFKYADGERIITIDDDLEVHPKEIQKLIDCSKEKDMDLIYGLYPPQNRSLIRTILTGFYKLLSKVEGSQKGKGSSFRMIKRSLAKKIVTNHTYFVFIDEIILWYSDKITFINVNFNPDFIHKKRYKVSGLFKISSSVIMFSSIMPLRVITYLGFTLATSNFIIGAWFIIKKLFLKMPVEGFTSLIVSILFSTGLIVLGLSVITQYLIQSMRSINNSPAYNEDEVIC